LAGGALPAGAELRRRQDAASVFDADRAEARILHVGTGRALSSDPAGFVIRAPSLHNAWRWPQARRRLIPGPEHPIDLALGGGAALTHQSLRAWSPLSRTAAEGAEHSEAGEGLAPTEIFSQRGARTAKNAGRSCVRCTIIISVQRRFGATSCCIN
jgi:hypothetical protein